MINISFLKPCSNIINVVRIAPVKSYVHQPAQSTKTSKDMSKKTPISEKYITHRIFTIRGEQAMIDRDLPEIYQVETKELNQAVKQRIERFSDT